MTNKTSSLSQKSPSSSLRLCWNSVKKQQGYGTINESSAENNNVEPQKNNSLKQEQQSFEQHNKSLDQIQNALFVRTRSSLGQENESANFTAESQVAKSLAAGASSCQQRIRCKKLVRRVRKVLSETLKFTSDRSGAGAVEEEQQKEQEDEDIYVDVSSCSPTVTQSGGDNQMFEFVLPQVNQLVTNSTEIYSYLGKGDAAMQEMRSRFESSVSSTSTPTRRIPRPAHLYSNAIHNQNLINNNSQNFINNNNHSATTTTGGGVGGGCLSKSVDNCWTGSNSGRFCNGNVVVATPSSEEDNSPTEMNSCRKFIDKPPLVKRLTMALLLKSSEDSRPLMCNSQNSNLNNYKTSVNSSYTGNKFSTSCASSPGKCSTPNYDGYVNEGICDLEQMISSKFGDSCRKSLMSIGHQETINWSIEHLNNQEFNFKKNLLRETSSGECCQRMI